MGDMYVTTVLSQFFQLKKCTLITEKKRYVSSGPKEFRETYLGLGEKKDRETPKININSKYTV